MRIAILIGCLFVMGEVCYGQSGNTPNNQKKSDNSLAPYYSEETQGKKPNSKKSNKKSKKKTPSGPSYQSEQEYYERMARLNKEKQKIAKEMEKPQYSNPMYFGHKRPPKKRKAGKLKYCKECGIRH